MPSLKLEMEMAGATDPEIHILEGNLRKPECWKHAVTAYCALIDSHGIDSLVAARLAASPKTWDNYTRERVAEMFQYFDTRVDSPVDSTRLALELPYIRTGDTRRRIVKIVLEKGIEYAIGHYERFVNKS